MGVGADGPRPLAVVLIEDDPGDALLVRELVADCAAPIDLHWCTAVAEAADRLVGADCVLLDLDLPDARGVEAVTRVQTDAPDVPIVVLTGDRAQGRGIDAVSRGAQDYLIKGTIDAEGFERALSYAIERKGAQRAAAALQASRMQERQSRRLMRGLLPAPLVSPGHPVQVTARYRPGRANNLLGGDFYDVVEDERGHIQVLIGDVAGHGPAEAALGVALRIAWRALVLAGVPVGTRLIRLEQLLRAERHADQVFATALCLSIDPHDRLVQVRRAGHPGVIEVGPAAARWIEPAGGPALGVVGDRPDIPGETITVAPGASLVLMTDGLFEGRVDAAGARLGEEGLLGLVDRCRETAPPGTELLDAVIEGAERASASYGGLADDVAALRVCW